MAGTEDDMRGREYDGGCCNGWMRLRLYKDIELEV